MTASHVSGPVIVYGVPTSGTATNTNPDAGPSITYGGDGLFDVRYPYGPGANTFMQANGVRSAPAVRGVTNFPYVCLVDAIPSTAATVGTITIGQTAGVLTANNSTWGINGSLQIIPSGSAYAAASQVTVCGVDCGFGSGTTNGTTAITSFLSSDGTGTAALQVGQPIFISGGNSSTSTFFTTVASITSSTAFKTRDAVPVSASLLAIGSAHPSLLTPDPYNAIGAAYMFDPRQGLTRALDYASSSAGDTTQTITVTGYDVYGVPMSETSATLTGVTHIPGKKAFKYIKTITASATCAGTITVKSGTAISAKDIIGINMRDVQWEYMNIFYNGAFVSSNTGWTAADTTSPATATTGDVRGTYALQTNAANGSDPATGRRLSVFMSVRQLDLWQASTANPVPLFGVTQV